MKKTIAIILITLMLCTLAGCVKPGGTDETPLPTSAAEPTAEATAAPTEAPTDAPTEEPTEDPDPVRTEALRLAEAHGLTEEELFGKYELFIRFSNTVEGNRDLGDFREFVCRIFPVIADNTEFIDEEYLLTRLAGLRFEVRELDPGLSGEFQFEPNLILIGTDFGESDENQLPSIVFHELMHFIDFSVNGDEAAMYLLDGERLSGGEFLELPFEDQLRALVLYEAGPVKEGGAELCTAKYFANAPRSYFNSCRFLTGLEYVCGSEAIDELFFSKNSDVLFAELLLDAGYTEDEYYDAAASLNWLTSPGTSYKPQNYMLPEDILIDLYEKKLGDGWKTDEPFLYILKSLNGIAWSGYEGSPHAEFLAGIDFNTRQQYDEFLAKVFAGLSEQPEVRYDPPAPVIREGRFTLAAFAAWTDPETGETISGTVAAEYDFEEEQPIGYEWIDMDAVLEEYFGGGQV